MKKNRQIAFGGLISALSLIAMLLSSVMPFAEYAFPALAGIFLIPIVIDFNKKTAIIAYGAISILSFIIVANKESVLLFVGFLGYYPIIKSIFEQQKKRITEWILKFTTFNVAVIIAYFILTKLLSIPVFYDTMGMPYGIAIVVLLVVANIIFILYDKALSSLIYMYITKLKPRLKLNKK